MGLRATTTDLPEPAPRTIGPVGDTDTQARRGRRRLRAGSGHPPYFRQHCRHGGHKKGNPPPAPAGSQCFLPTSRLSASPARASSRALAKVALVIASPFPDRPGAPKIASQTALKTLPCTDRSRTSGTGRPACGRRSVSHQAKPRTVIAAATSFGYGSPVVSSVSWTPVGAFFRKARENVFEINGSSMAAFLRCNSM